MFSGSRECGCGLGERGVRVWVGWGWFRGESEEDGVIGEVGVVERVLETRLLCLFSLRFWRERYESEGEKDCELAIDLGEEGNEREEEGRVGIEVCWSGTRLVFVGERDRDSEEEEEEEDT